MPDLLDSLTPVGTEVPAGLEAACALPGVRAFTAPDDPEITLLVPAERRARARGHHPGPGRQRADHDRGVRRVVPRGPARRPASKGEILIVDASPTTPPPSSPSRAAPGCCTRRMRGLGRAYIDAIPYVRGRYVIMGDADCTYDFRKLAPFVEAMRSGTEYAMGSRWKGSIETGAMPPLHQYFGTPFTTWILNRLYGSHFSDIHCGMRGITRDALLRMGIVSQSWEYASEMVLKSVRMELRDHRGPGHLPQGPGRSALPPQAVRLVLAVRRRLDQPARDVHPRRRVLPLQARHRPHCPRAAAVAAPGVRRHHRSARSPSASYTMLRRRRPGR